MICSHCWKKIFSNHRKQLSHGENMQITYQTKKGWGGVQVQNLTAQPKAKGNYNSRDNHTHREKAIKAGGGGGLYKCFQRILKAHEGHLALRTKLVSEILMTFQRHLTTKQKIQSNTKDNNNYALQRHRIRTIVHIYTPNFPFRHWSNGELWSPIDSFQQTLLKDNRLSSNT